EQDFGWGIKMNRTLLYGQGGRIYKLHKLEAVKVGRNPLYICGTLALGLALGAYNFSDILTSAESFKLYLIALILTVTGATFVTLEVKSKAIDSDHTMLAPVWVARQVCHALGDVFEAHSRRRGRRSGSYDDD
ncbi:MAG: hypothetical protein AAF950_18435, partial [Pseudomonadota bacterium]